MANYIHWTRAEERTCINFASRDYCSPLNYNRPAMDTLYRNQGNGVFEDISKSAGLDQKFGNSFGVVIADFNVDGRLDFYIANDGDGNQLWINQGDGRFVDEALLSGCAYDWRGWAQAGMGVTVVDVDHDGDVDLFTTNLYEESNTLLVNQGGHFEDRTVRFGLDAPSRGRTGFGVGFADFDHDGHLDLYVANGAVKYSSAQIRAGDPYAETNLVFRGAPSGSFGTVSPPGGTASPLVATSRAAAFGDLDGDGDIDVVVVNKDRPPHLLRNLVGQDRNWIMLQVLDHRGNDAIGARVTLELPDRRQVRIVQRAYSYCASNDVRCHFGLGSTATAAPVVVAWLDGRTERFGPLAPGRVHTLREGGTHNHSLIAINVGSALRNALRGRPFYPLNSDMRLKVEATSLYSYPDIQVVCGPARFEVDRNDTLLNPTLIEEVLSPSTAAWIVHKKTLELPPPKVAAAIRPDLG